MEFTITTILFGILYIIILFSFFTIFPVSLGALYLWFILKMFHSKNINFWRVVGTSFFSYVVIIISMFVSLGLIGILSIGIQIKFIKDISYGSIIFSSLIGITVGTLRIRKLIKESWSHSILISFLVLLLTAATFYLIIWSPIGGFIIPPEQ